MPMQTRKKGWSRSKRGCKTCRIRHVKCDETHPVCSRCTSTGRTCDGTASPASDSWDIMTPLTAVANPSLELLSRSQSPDDKVNASFYYFRSRTAAYLSRLLGLEWEDVVLRASFHSEAIRYAILAVASVHQNVETGQGLGIATSTNQWAIKQYNKSLRSLTLGTCGGMNVPVDVVLATCILYICFETLHRNHGVVLKHVKGGLEILGEYRNRVPNGNSNTMIPLKQLTAAFARLEIQFCEVMPHAPALFPAIIHTQDISGYYSNCIPLPLPIPQFKTFDDAWTALDKIWHAMKCWLADTQREFDPINTSPSKCRLIQQRDWLFNDFSMWKVGFDQWKTKNEALVQRQVRVSALLECHVHLAIQNLKTIPGAGEMSWDQCLEEFEKVVDLCHAVVEADVTIDGQLRAVQIEQRYTSGGMQSGASDDRVTLLSLGMGILPIYLHVLQKCRDAQVRLRVIKQLEQNPRLEGLWDGLLVASIGRMIDEIERQESNLEDAATRSASVSEIPAWARVLSINMCFTTEERVADLIFTRARNETNNDMMQIHKSIRW